MYATSVSRASFTPLSARSWSEDVLEEQFGVIKNEANYLKMTKQQGERAPLSIIEPSFGGLCICECFFADNSVRILNNSY